MGNTKTPITTPDFPTGTPENNLDLAIRQMKKDLEDEIDDIIWFGLAERRISSIDGSIYPASWVGSQRDYLNMMPTDEWSPGYGFFDVNDPVDILYNRDNGSKYRNATLTVTLSVIAYINLRQYDTNQIDYRATRQDFRNLLLGSLERKLLSLQGDFEPKRIYDRTIEDIFKGYSVKGVGDQYLQMPWYGIRIEGELTFAEYCKT